MVPRGLTASQLLHRTVPPRPQARASAHSQAGALSISPRIRRANYTSDGPDSDSDYDPDSDSHHKWGCHVPGQNAKLTKNGFWFFFHDMATTTTADVPMIDTEDLSDEAIQVLLKQAEQRLQNQPTRTAQNAIAQERRNAASLHVSPLPQPYISSGQNQDIARIDDRRILDENQRRLASGIRKVQDPVALQQRQLAVSLSPFSVMPMRKIIPIFS